MAEETRTEDLLHRLFDQFNEHLETRWRLFSLTAAEKLSGIAADVAGAATVFVFAILVLLFFSLSLAWWLGDFIGSRAGGFALTGLIFVPIGAGVNHWVRGFASRKVIESALKEDVSEKPANHE